MIANTHFHSKSKKVAMAEAQVVSTAEVAAHSQPGDCWIVLEDHVWDLTKFADEHPGGASSTSKAIFNGSFCDFLASKFPRC